MRSATSRPSSSSCRKWRAWVWLNTDGTATTVWISPGASELSAGQERKGDTLLHTSLGTRAAAVVSAFEAFAEARPTEPHYYLTRFGTDPRHAGRGVGTWLLEVNLDRVDARGAAAYLEARDELVPFYSRFGFRVRRRFEVEEGPTVNGMWRDPRSAPVRLQEP